MNRRDLNVCYEQLGFADAPFRMTPDTDYFFARRSTCTRWSICNSGSRVANWQC